ncbi:shikimate dehydrogenase family protein [Pseudarthrobacter defluvii]|uniref:shikimate dehydrogenase family protein n=1 Tax=Pseudarthrobacter defluvii TaxID=410837 RepID=UPI002576C45B|nr:shikimate dehydrogenase [Pseudarthrobacter defluvii]WJH24444.1 shikimate dehydrogenase [Pseudarthrobacter defluvii]
MEPHSLTSRLVLIGSAASQAMSPALWNPVLARLGNGWRYEAWDVPPDGDLAQVRKDLLGPDMVAANVTMPHKHWAAETADAADESVRLSGACNLLVRAGERLEAHNTDITAARKLLGPTYQRHALLLGAGGAARAALISIRDNVGAVSIADRDPHASAELLELARELGLDAHAIMWEQARDAAADASLIVNATPIGKQASDPAAWGGAALAPDAVLYDFVYARHTTASVACADAMGIRCIDGWDHLREQAVAMVPLLGLDGEAGALLQETLIGLRDVH